MKQNDMLPAVVEQQVANGNYNYMVTSRNHGATIYGDIAAALEAHSESIDRLAEDLGSIAAERHGIQITKEYEDNAPFFEKYFRSNTLSRKKMELRREAETELVSDMIQIVVKGAVYTTKKVLSVVEQKKIKDYVWAYALIYVDGITGGNPERMEPYVPFLISLGKSLKRAEKKYLLNDDLKACAKSSIRLDSHQLMQTAAILYQLFDLSQCRAFITEEKIAQNKQFLMDLWMSMQIGTYEADDLFRRFEGMRNRVDPYGSLNQITQYLFSNLSITLPNINRASARRVNDRLLLYTPNGERQLLARKATKFMGKAAITAACAAGGIATENQVMMKIAATTALSMFHNVEDRELIGNCLVKSGILEGDVKKCIEESRDKKVPTLL